MPDAMSTLDWGAGGAAVYVASRVLTLLSRVQSSVTDHLVDMRAIARADVDARAAMAEAVASAAAALASLASVPSAFAPTGQRGQGSQD